MTYPEIIYKNIKKKTYKSLKFNYTINDIQHNVEFNSGDIIIDFFDYMKHLYNQSPEFYYENSQVYIPDEFESFFKSNKKFIKSKFDPDTFDFIDSDTHDYNIYPDVVHTKNHKNFIDVKNYYKKTKI